jgi:hypothetical protein
VLVGQQRLSRPGGHQVRLDAQQVHQHLALVGLGAINAKATGRPCRVQTRCSRSPQK